VIPLRPRVRALVIAVLAVLTAAGFAAVSGATTAATAPSNTAPPTVTGSTQQGSTLTTTSGSWSGTTPITFAYKWQRCDSSGASCADIAGATAQTYTITSSDVGHTLRSVVTASNSGGSASADSAHTAVVTGATPPTNTGIPAISGSTTVGSTLTTTKGTWTGTAPIGYQYQWRRCDTSGGACASISGAIQQTYVLTNGDAGHTIRVVVTATNSGGQAQAPSAQTATVTAGAPANTVAPAITGTATQGQTLTVSTGTWTGSTPITFAYSWERCDGSGNSCATISGATSAKYVLTATDVSHKLRALVTATNSAGSAHTYAAAVGPVAAPPSTLPPGAVKLPDGEISIPASSVPDTDRLTISSVSFSPSVIHGRAPVVATLKVTDANKYVISGALVYVLGVPYNWATKAAETPTAQDGTVKITIAPTAKAPRKAALVLFVRARTPQGNKLAGSSTRRLVSVRMRP
jgi:hypothetical protein